MPVKPVLMPLAPCITLLYSGIERKVIFKESQDYSNFLNRLRNVLKETKIPCFARTLMTNHAHILLRTGYVPISTVMQRLLLERIRIRE